jgi:cobalt-zinc-cadmium efflux system protein
MEAKKDQKRSSKSTFNLRLAFLLNFFFAIVEVIGGLWTNSIAILSEALHDLGDSFSLGLSWYLEKVAQREKNWKYPYGYKRFSLLAALINSVILVGGSIFILSEAIPRLLDPEQTYALGMFYFAIGGILVNGIAVWKMREGQSMNERVVTWHLLEDVLGWMAVLVISIVMMIKNIPILDPILSILIALYILWNVIKMLRKTLSIFLQKTPPSIDIESIEKHVNNISKVISTHDTRIWSLDGESHVLTTHVVIEQDTAPSEVEQIKNEVHHHLRKFDIQHSTVEIEYEGESCELRE